MKVLKRGGTTEEFNVSKIVSAVEKAFKACDKEMSDIKEIYNLNNPCKMMNELTKDCENGNYLVEVGEIITPTWKTTFSAGSYTYGPDTEVTPT